MNIKRYLSRSNALTISIKTGLILTFFVFIPMVYASSPWTQTDWSGGVGSSPSNQYSTSSNLDPSTSISLSSNGEKLTNTGFETDLTNWSAQSSAYLLQDEFTSDLAAGSVNGTAAEPGPGTRTVVDTNNKLNITGGKLNFVSGGSAYNNPDAYWGIVNRITGRIFTWNFYMTSGYGLAVGGDSDASGNISESLTSVLGDILNIRNNNGGIDIGTATTTGVSYTGALILKNTGTYYYIKGGAFSNWTLVWSSHLNSSNLYPRVIVGNTGTSGTVDYIRIPSATFLPTPLLYDTFTRADGAIGSSETTGPDAQTTTTRAYTGSTWTISSNGAVNNPTLGSELIGDVGFDDDAYWTKGTNTTVSGSKVNYSSSAVNTGVTKSGSNLSVNTWYQSTFDIDSISSGGLYPGFQFSQGLPKHTSIGIGKFNISRATNANYMGLWASQNATIAVADNFSIKSIILSSLFATAETSTSNVLVDTNVTMTSGTQAGVVLNLDNADSPANFVIAYHNGTNVKLEKNVGGTYTTVQSTTTTYSAGATLRVVKDGTSYTVYYNNAIVGSAQTISDAGIIDNTLHGMFSTYSGNTLDNFAIWPRGTGNEYAQLDAYDGDGAYSVTTSELATRDTSTKYGGSTASSKLVASYDAEFVQNINVGDTNNYNLIAYAYTDGTAVTSADLELFYGSSVVATTFTDQGSGWYRLNGTTTGIASAQPAGVRVKSGKTVYVDNLSLSRYETSGSMTSSIFDSEFTAGSDWGTLSYTATTPTDTTVTVKVRTSNSPSMTGATDFGSCTAINSGSDISANSCVTDAHRYIQYQLNLAASDTSTTPSFNDFTINYATSDADAPSITLTALSPDPIQDNTPTISGVATESIGTITSIQYQLDSTAGSWLDCSASDETLDEGEEQFSCLDVTPLADGSHTMYFKATDSSSNSTAADSYPSDSFTIDTTAPLAVSLNSPGDQAYTNTARPTFRWKATTDATTSIRKYKLVVDNPLQADGNNYDFEIDDIPASRTTNLTTEKYTIEYSGFDDENPENNYLSLNTISTSQWTQAQNHGELASGTVVWKVIAYDQAGNTKESSHTLYLDQQPPTLSNLTLRQQGVFNIYHLVTTNQPQISGLITDNIAPQKLEFLTYQKHFVLGVETARTLVSLETLDLNNPEKKLGINVNYTLSSPLAYGKYTLEIKGYDQAGNTVIESLNLEILSATQAQQYFNLDHSNQDPDQSSDSAIGEDQAQSSDLNQPTADQMFPVISIPELEGQTEQRLQLQAQNLESIVTALQTLLTSISNYAKHTYIALTTSTNTVIENITAQANQLTSQLQSLPGQTTNAATGLLLPVNNYLNNTKTLITEKITQTRQITFDRLANIAQGTQSGIQALRTSIINTNSFPAKVITGAKIGFSTFYAHVFDSQPTTITNLQVTEAGKDYVIITWETNHYSMGKISYGDSYDYGQDVQSTEYKKQHQFKIENLTPNTTYNYEVMNQGKNYVYDARHEFKTEE